MTCIIIKLKSVAIYLFKKLFAKGERKVRMTCDVYFAKETIERF